MNKTKSLKARFVSALLVLCMAVTSLIGTTFAWFTDEVTSAGNKIETGSLKVDLLHKVDDTWVSLKKKPEHKVFENKKWEPGYTEIETLKIENLGTLALQYRLSIEVAALSATLGKNGENLADVISVYVTYEDTTESSFSDIIKDSKWTYKGSLSEVMKNPQSFIGGQLLPEGKTLDGTEEETVKVGSQTVKIALHMQESAGNAYQELNVGNIFVNLLATQWGYENDSFNNGYDNGATFPPFSGSFVASTNVNVNNNTVSDTVSFKNKDGEISATVPAGTVLEDGVNNLTLTVSTLDSTSSNVTASGNQVLNSVDVHVSGVSKNNTAPIIITVKELLAPGLNVGNYQLYHVENGTTAQMTSVAAAQDVDAHNEFYYNPATGDVTLALATFSEITLVADTESVWQGNFDYEWYDADAKESSSLQTLTSLQPLAQSSAVWTDRHRIASKAKP